MLKKVLIADDEQHVCDELKHILSNEKDFEILPFAKNGIQALAMITDLKPEVVFLDIDMPGLNGIEIGKVIIEMRNPPFVIYVTAYDQFAVDAFHVNAVGYLLKPISSKDVVSKLNLVREYSMKKMKGNTSKIDKKNLFEDRISYKMDDKYVFFEQKDIVLAYAKNRSVYLRVNGVNYLYNYSLTLLEKKLNKNYFFRCHRNYIVNIAQVKEAITWFNGTYLLTMKDFGDFNIIVSRNKVKDLKRILNL